MSGETLYVFGVLAVSIGLFVSDKVRLDIVAVLVILALAISGILTPKEALSGFGDPVVVLIAALFIVGEGLFYTGIAFTMGDLIVKVAGNREMGLIVVLMVAVGSLSAFMSSTGAVAIFIPVAVRLAIKAGLAPARFLMPMAIGSLIGGMLTLIGTPPNLIVSGQLVKAGLAPFAFFDFTPIGLAILATAIVYMLTIGRHLLPASKPSDAIRRDRRTLADLTSSYGTDSHMVRITVRPGSPLIGQTVVQAALRTKYGITVFAFERHGQLQTQVRPIHASTHFAVGDILYAVDSATAAPALATDQNVEIMDFNGEQLNVAARDVGLADILLLPNSALLGQTLASSRFRQTYDLSVLAVARKGLPMEGSFANAPLDFGDALLVSGSWKQIRALRSQHKDFVVLSLPEELDEQALGRDQAPLALLVVAAMLALMAFKIVPTVMAALLAAIAMVLLRCVPANRIYKAINWQSLVLIAGMLPMATALEKTGGLKLMVDTMMGLVGQGSPLLVMAALFLLTSALSQVISNTATTVLIAPVAFGVANLMGVAPQPLLMAVALSASSAFATPVASPVNTLVLGPGKYKFSDFVKVGLPLQVLVMVVTLLVVPVFFPF